MRIQHNIMAMNAYRNYNLNTSALSKNLEKLSSGYKINRAGDDAAGLAISEKMRAQITGLDAAQKNVKDGISLVKTAEGAMQEIQDMLNRMDYLATQSANGTYQDKVDREALQDEVNALLDEIDRIAKSANFNGQKLLDGTLDTGATTSSSNATKDIIDIEDALTVKADGTQVIGNGDAVKGKYSADLTNTKINVTGASSAVAKVSISVGGTVVAAITVKLGKTGKAELSAADMKKIATVTRIAVGSGAGKVTLNVDVTGGKITLTMADDPTADQVATMEGKTLNVAFSAANATIVQNSNGTVTDNTTGNQAYAQSVKPEQIAKAKVEKLYAQAEIDLTKLDIKDGATLKIDNKTYTFAVGANSAQKKADGTVPSGVIDLTKYESITDAGAAASAARQIANQTDPGKFKVSTTNDAGKIHLTETNVDYTKNDLQGGAGAADAKPGWKGLITFDSSGKGAQSTNGAGLTLQIGDDNEEYNHLTVGIKSMLRGSLGIDGLSIENATNAGEAIDKIKAAINTVSSTRGKLGAIQNRLEHTQNNLSVMAENIQDAESTIRDTDVADEMMKYVKNNILVQSAQAMLAQANQVPQGVLQLLG